MAIVADAAGRPWTIELTVGACKRLRSIGVDVFDAKLDFAELVSDVPRFVVAIYAVVAPQAALRSIGPDDFAERADGEFVDRTIAAVAGEMQALTWLAPTYGASETAASLEAWEAIYEFAGIVGVDPENLTPGQLARMAHGRRVHDWDIASAHLCMFANANRDKKARSRPFEQHEFHPFRKRSAQAPRKLTKEETAARWKAMRKAFGGKFSGK